MSHNDDVTESTTHLMPDDQGSPARQDSWRFWLRWVLATALGWAAGMMVYIFLAPILGVMIGLFAILLVFPAFVFLGSAFGAIIGWFFGWTQWLILRQELPLSWQWIWSTAGSSAKAGAFAGVFIFLAFVLGVTSETLFRSPTMSDFQPVPFEYMTFAIAGAIGGFGVGRAQGRILQHWFGSTQWMLIGVVGGFVAWLITGLLSYFSIGNTIWPVLSVNSLVDAMPLISFAALSGAIYAALTGVVLARALRRSRQKVVTNTSSWSRRVFAGLLLLSISNPLVTTLSDGLQLCQWLDDALNRSGCIRLIDTAKSVSDIAFSVDGAQLAVGTDFRGIEFWSVSDGRLLYVLSDFSEGPSQIVFSPRDQLLAAMFTHNIKIIQWRGERAVVLHTILHDYVQSVAFSPDGTLLVSGAVNEVYLWRVKDNALLRTYKMDGEDVTNVAFSPDGTLLAARTDPDDIENGGEVRVWRIADGVLLSSWSGVELPGLAFSPDGTMLASAQGIWRVSDWSLIHRLDVSHRSDMMFSPDGNMFIVSDRFRIKYRNVSDWTLLRTEELPHYTYGIRRSRSVARSVATFSPDVS